MGLTRFPGGLYAPIVVPGGFGGASVGLGEVKWVVPAKASTDTWYERIRTFANDRDIFTSLQAAHDACTTDQGDTIYVAPGTYTTISETDFTKSYINVIGLAGPNTFLTSAATRTMPGCTFNTVTASVENVLHVSGHRNNFYGLSFVNAGANAANDAAVCIGNITTNDAWGNYFSTCTFHGIMSASQNSQASSSVEIGSGAANTMIENCLIGQNTFGGSRTADYQGHVYMGGTVESSSGAGYGPQNVIFRDCIHESRSTSSYITVVAFRIGGESATPTGDEAWDRTLWVINNHFSSWGNGDTAISSVFDVNTLSGGLCRIVDSSAHAYGEWRLARASQAAESFGTLSVNMPVSNVAEAGIAVAPTS